MPLTQVTEQFCKRTYPACDVIVPCRGRKAHDRDRLRRRLLELIMRSGFIFHLPGHLRPRSVQCSAMAHPQPSTVVATLR